MTTNLANMTPSKNDATENCFTRDELKDFSLGRTGDYLAIKIESHLANCGECEDTFVSLERSEDTVVRDLRRLSQSKDGDGDSSGPDSPDPHLSHALSKAKRLIPPNFGSAKNEFGPLQNGEPVDDALLNVSEGEFLAHVGDYELCELVGRGGMGQVFRARHCRLQKEFAVKLLHGRRLQSAESVSRFQREMKIVGRLDHPAIVQATDAGQFGETHYLTMEFVSGLNLSCVLHHQSPLAIPDACEMVRQTALGIQYAHQMNIVHRDIKPSNLMLNKKGNIKILDLGLATLNGLNHAVDELTTVGQMLGTLDYMAPEQCDDQLVDHRCDIYSLGATLYKLLTGLAPYSGADRTTPLQKMRAMMSDSIVPVQNHRLEISSELAELIGKCLNRDPEARYQSAAELAQDLESFCKGNDLPKLLADAESDELQRKKLSATRSESALPSASIKPFQDDIVKPDGSGFREMQTPISESRFDSSQVAANAKAKSERLQTAPGRARTGKRWMVALALLALIPLVALGIQIVINWQNGQLVIESDNPNVHVRLVKDGKVYKELDIQQGANSTTVRAGKYEIVIDDPSDRMVVTNGTFELKRGEVSIAKISSRPVKKMAAAKGTDGISKNNVNAQLSIKAAPTFQGKTLEQWMDDPRYPEILNAARALKRVSDKESLRVIIRETVKEYENEQSLEELYARIEAMSILCPDEESAEVIMDLAGKVFQRYSVEEILEGNVKVNLKNAVSGESVKKIDFQLSFLKLQNGRNAFFNKVLNGLMSKNEVKVAFGLRMAIDAEIPNEFMDEIVTATTKLYENSEGKIKGYSFKLFEKRLSMNSIAQQWMISALPTAKPGLRQCLYNMLSKNPSNSRLVARSLARDIASDNSLMFDSWCRQACRISALGNSDMMRELETILEHPQWGWECLPIRLEDNSPMSNPDGWFGRYGTGGFKDSQTEQNATERSRRVILMRNVRYFSMDGPNYQEAKQRLVQGAVPVLRRELDTKYNDYYLNIVLDILGDFQKSGSVEREKFWVGTWESTKEQELRTRALSQLQEMVQAKTNSGMDAGAGGGAGAGVGGDSDSGRTPDRSRIAKLIVEAMRDLNCVTPNDNELEKIKEACQIVRSDDFVKNNAFWKDQIANGDKSDLPFLLWFFQYGLDGTTYELSRIESGQLIQKSKDHGDFLVRLRAAAIESNRRRPTALVKMASDEQFAKNRYLILCLLTSKRARYSSRLDNDFRLKVLENGSAKEVAAMLDYCRAVRSKGPVLRRNPNEHGGEKNFSTRDSYLIQLLINPREELLESADLYRVDCWSKPIDRPIGREMPNVHRLISFLLDEQFTEKDFEGKKDEIIANLAKVAKDTADEQQKHNALTLMNRVAKSESILAYQYSLIVAESVRRYQKAFEQFPDAVDDLLKRPDHLDAKAWRGPFLKESFTRDPWKNEFRIIIQDDKKGVTILSAGPDGKFETEDDVSSLDKELEKLVD